MVRRFSEETQPSKLPDDERWLLVTRISSSPLFQRSARLRSLLLHVAEQSLLGNSHALHEHDIGCAVFNREPGYNPVDDNIVRVHARQLRMRLESYFQTYGKDEALEIVIPKGAYVPQFVSRDANPRTVIDNPPASESIASVIPSAPPTSKVRWAFGAILGAVCLLLAADVWLRAGHAATARSSSAPPWLLAAVMHPDQPAIIVAPDSGIPLYSDIFGRTVSLTDYLNPRFMESAVANSPPETRRTFESIERRSMVTFQTGIVMAQLAVAAEKYGWKAQLRFAHHMNAREFDEGNFILIGNSAANPWVGLYEKELNFRSVWNPETQRTQFLNQSPRIGEETTYKAELSGQQVIDSYGVIALIRRHEGTRGRNVLILEGLNSEGTEAVTSFACDPVLGRQLRSVGKATDGIFEALLHLRSVGGAVSESKVISQRPAP